MSIQERAAEIIERLRAAYNVNRSRFDWDVSQHVDGIHNQELRREIIRRLTGTKIPAKECTVYKVSDTLKISFDQLILF